VCWIFLRGIKESIRLRGEKRTILRPGGQAELAEVGVLCHISFRSFSIISYNVSCFAPYRYKISSEASSMTAIIRSTSSSVSVDFILGLLAHVFFLSEDFCGETFIFFDVLASVRGSFGSVTSPFSLFSPSSPPLS
jgi:hypothetical protein